MIFPDFAKFCLKSVRISYFSLKFSRNFAGIAGFVENESKIAEILHFSSILKGAKGRQAAK